MSNSGSAAALQRRFPESDLSAVEVTDIIRELSDLIIAEANANDRPPPDLSPDAYASIMEQLESLDTIDAPVESLGKIATNDVLVDEPQVRNLHGVASVPPPPSPVQISIPSSGLTTNRRPTPTSTNHTSTQSKPTASWKHLPENQKFKEACRVAEDLKGFTFSLDLSARVERTLWTHKNPCRLLSSYINRALKAQGVARTPFSFAVEYAPLKENYRGVIQSKLHLHGVVISNDREKVETAMRIAGGEIGGKSAGTRFKRKPFDAKRGGGPGWARYILKDEERTWRHIDGERVTFISDSLRRLTRDRWQELRPVKRRQRKTEVVTAPVEILDERRAVSAFKATQKPRGSRFRLPGPIWHSSDC